MADAKLNFDDNAEYRQPNIWKYQDTTEEDPREVEAAKVEKRTRVDVLNCVVLSCDLAL